MKIQKKTMKKPLALLLGVTLILMIAGVAKAQVEFSNSGYMDICSLVGASIQCPHRVCPETAASIFDIPCSVINIKPYSPKIACYNSQICVAVDYDDANNAIVVLISSDQFHNTYQIGSILVDYSTALHPTLTNYTNYSLPYDVVWDSHKNLFWIGMSDNNGNSKFYTYDPNGAAVITLNWSLTYSTVNSYSFLGFYDKTTYPKAAIVYATCNFATVYENTYFVNGTAICSGSICKSLGSLGCSPLCISFQALAVGRGSVFEKTSGGYPYTEAGIMATCGGQSGAWQAWHIYSDLSGFPSSPPRDGILYWDGQKILYHVSENVTGNITGGVYSTGTTDLVSFGTPFPYYVFNQSIAEDIPAAATFITDKQIFLSQINTNVSDIGATNKRGIWSYSQP
jgi:hypothetical protein